VGEQTRYFIVAAVWVLLLVESNKRPYLRDWLYFVILPPHLGCLIWCNPNRAHHGLDIVRCNYVLIWGKLWREMTPDSNSDVISFHNAFRGACVMKSAKKRGFNGIRCDWMHFTLISVIWSIMCGVCVRACVCESVCVCVCVCVCACVCVGVRARERDTRHCTRF
jgi:hypothetical protein